MHIARNTLTRSGELGIPVDLPSLNINIEWHSSFDGVAGELTFSSQRNRTQSQILSTNMSAQCIRVQLLQTCEEEYVFQ